MEDNSPTLSKRMFKRKSHTCPVPGCGKSVIHLPRHLKKIHAWSHAKALEAMSVFNLRGRTEKIPCPMQDCRKSAVNMKHHLKKWHKLSDDQMESILSAQPVDPEETEAKPPAKKKREFRRRVCPYPGCNHIVRRIHNHLNDKHKLSRNNPRYKKYLRSARFEEIDVEGPITVLSSSEQSDSEQTCGSHTKSDVAGNTVHVKTSPSLSSHGAMSDEEDNNSKSSSSLSSEEAEEMLRRIQRKKSDRAKAIMKCSSGITGLKRAKPVSSGSQVSTAKTKKVKLRQQVSSNDEDDDIYDDGNEDDDDDDEDVDDDEDDDDEDVIPPTPPSIFEKIIKSFHSDEPEVLQPRSVASLPGEKPNPVTWNLTARFQGKQKEKNDNNSEELCPEIQNSRIAAKERPQRKMCDSNAGFFAQVASDDDEEEYVPSQGSDESDTDFEEDMEDDCIEAENNPGSARGNSRTDEILEQFKKWLEGIDGGRRSSRTARQYVSQISTVISHVDPIKHNVSALLNKKDLRDKWLEKMEKLKRPGTCKAYLGSLSKFLRFIAVDQPQGLESLKDEALKVREQAQEWMCSYKKPLAERRWEKLVDDLEKLITPEEIQKFDKSEKARQAVSTLGSYMEKTAPAMPTQSDYCQVRDHLIARLCIENACRAGPLSNMTIGELQKARKDGSDMVVTVMKHKTVVTHGPASVVLSPTVLTWLQTFVKHMRSKLPGAGIRSDDKVFLSWTASEMSSSMISAQLNSFWHKAMGKQLDRVCATSFRKAAVSEIHENHDNLKGDLADLMGHHQKTAEKYYRIRQKSKSAARTSEALRKIMYTPRNSTEADISNVSVDPKGRNENVQKEDNQTEQEDKETMGYSGSPRHRWTNEENAAVKTVFQTDIEKGMIGINTVKEKIKGHPFLARICPGKVIDKVRSFARLEDASNSEKSVPLPDKIETLQEKIARLNQQEDSVSVGLMSEKISQRGGTTFSDVQTEIFWRLFKDLIESNRCIQRKEICQRIQEDEEAREAIVGFTPQQLCDKIRTERRKIVRSKTTK